MPHTHDRPRERTGRTVLGEIVALDPSTVSRRCDVAKLRSSTDPRVPKAVEDVLKGYAMREQGSIAILQV